GRGQKVGPQLALDEDADIGPPVVEEGGDGRGGVDRGELVDDAARQAAGQHLSRGQGAGGDQNRHVGPVLADALGQWKDGQGLADADAVNPDQRPVGARQAGQAQTFIDAGGVFLALLDAGVQQARGQRLQQAGQQLIGDQGGAEEHVQTRSSPVRASARASTAVRRAVQSAVTSARSAPSGYQALSQTTAPLPNGKGSRARSQLFSRIAGLHDMPMNSTGAPEI